ncbi:MAG: hypothetical protein EOP45_14640 [Sphingobacteriaceae bacterium]|nr:MAG: hypothetical protein EOP45_14640 [Sphingobacteriaceae bacterium]
MKKTSLGFLAAVIILASCQKSDAPKEDLTEIEPTAEIGQRCASTELFEQQVAEDPGFLQRRQQIESYTQTVLKNKSNYRLLADGTVEIPVVVHVIYSTTAQNISDAQVQSQIDVLNEDFTKTNADNAKNQKYKCLMRLKKIFFAQYNHS